MRGPTVKVTTDGAPQTPFNVRKSNQGTHSDHATSHSACSPYTSSIILQPAKSAQHDQGTTDKCCLVVPVITGRAREKAARDAFLESGAIVSSTTTDAADAIPAVVAAKRGQHNPVAHKQASDPAAEELAVSAAEFSAIHELRLAFARAASRLVEMSTAEYLSAHAIIVATGKWQGS